MALRASTAAKNAVLDTADIKTSLTNAKLYIYTGSRPSTANAASTGTKLVTFTTINWGTAADGELALAALETAVAAATGIAGWFRLTTTSADPDADDTATKTRINYDGTVSASGSGDLNGNHTSITSGETVTLQAATKFVFST